VELSEYARHDATALAELVRRRDVTPRELAEAALDASERLDPTLGALVERYHDLLDQLDRSPPATGPFAGVPFVMKDAGAAEAGRRQERGSRAVRGWRATGDSSLTRRFRSAGLVSVGRSAAPEFSLSLETVSALHGATRNPWDPSLSAGGSSGGAAAAVAAGIVSVAHGTDAAGSIRIPASACGLVGLKPSRGRVSHGPEVGEPLLGMDTQFVLTRSVRDAAALLDAVAGPEPGDPTPLPPPTRPFVEALHAPGPRLRVALTADAWGGYPTDPDVRAAAETVAALLEDLGHHVEVDAPVFDYGAFVDAAIVGWALGFDGTVDALARETGTTAGPDTLEPVTFRLYERSRLLRAADVARAEERANTVRRDIGTFFERYDVLLTPTLLRPPEPLGSYDQATPWASFDEFFLHCDRTGAFLPPFNLTGQPAVSLPLAWSGSGLPLGMQFVARFAGEATLLALAAELEAAAPWRDRRPGIRAGLATTQTAGPP
jgi:amidase